MDHDVNKNKLLFIKSLLFEMSCDQVSSDADEETTKSSSISDNKHIEDFDLLDVLTFLSEIGVPEYRDAFFKQGIDGELLVTLDDEDLLYVPVLDKDHRQYILNKIAEYRQIYPKFEKTPEECAFLRVTEWLRENAEYLPIQIRSNPREPIRHVAQNTQ